MTEQDERELLNLILRLGPKTVQQWLTDNVSKMDLKPFGEVTIIKNRFLPPYSGFFYNPPEK